jgi:hypothetical protein
MEYLAVMSTKGKTVSKVIDIHVPVEKMIQFFRERGLNVDLYEYSKGGEYLELAIKKGEQLCKKQK